MDGGAKGPLAENPFLHYGTHTRSQPIAQLSNGRHPSDRKISGMMRNKIILAAILIALYLASASGCGWVRDVDRGAADSREIVYQSPRLTLAWDPPISSVAGTTTEIAKYYLYFRERGSLSWWYLGAAAASPHPQYTVHHQRLGDGFWEFAVSAVTAQGGASDRHSSVDECADPFGGWFVFWLRSD